MSKLFEPYEAVFKVKAAATSGDAFQVAAEFFHSCGFASIGFGVPALEEAEGHLNDLRCDAVYWHAFSGEREERDGYESYSQEGLFETDPGARPFFFGNSRPYRVGSELNHVLSREEQTRRVLKPLDHGLHSKRGTRACWIIPTATQLSLEAPMSHLNLYASAVSETQFGHFDRHLNAYAMVAHALTDRLQGDVLRTFLGIPHLSPRERECLTFTAVGLRPAQIAHRLNMTKHTVDFHLKSARKKLNALTLTHAVARAIELEEITPW